MMDTRLVNFLDALAWLTVVGCVSTVALNTLLRRIQSPIDAAFDAIYGRTWESRTPYIFAAVIAAIWLWTSGAPS